MNKTLSAKFIKRANEVMVMSGMNIIAYKRQMGYGSGEKINLIFDLDGISLIVDNDIDLEDLDAMKAMCPPTFMDNETNEIYFIVDECPLYMSKVSQMELDRWERGLTDIKRYLRRLGF